MKRILHSFPFLLLISVVLVSFNCHKDVTKDNGKQIKSFEQIALEKYKNNIGYMYSPDSSFVACFRKETKEEANGVQQLRFFIYDIKNDKLVFEDNLRSENILWLNNYKLKVMKRPGMVTNDPQKNIELMGYIYDIKQNKKLPLQNLTDDKLLK